VLIIVENRVENATTKKLLLLIIGNREEKTLLETEEKKQQQQQKLLLLLLVVVFNAVAMDGQRNKEMLKVYIPLIKLLPSNSSSTIMLTMVAN